MQKVQQYIILLLSLLFINSSFGQISETFTDLDNWSGESEKFEILNDLLILL